MKKNITDENGKNNLKKRKGCLPVFLAFIALCACFTIFVIQKGEKPTAQSELPILIDATQFSRISEEKLVELIGEPTEIEQWRNKTSDISGYDMTTYAYVDGDVCYSYAFTTNMAGEKPLVYMIVDFNYNGEGSNLECGLDKAIFERFGITPSKYVKVEADTGYAIRWSGVSNEVYEVWAQIISNDDGMVDWVKIKFDPKFPL